MIDWIRFILTAVLVIAGLAVCCIGVYGIFKFKYAANRMHAAALIDTMGIALTMIGFAVSAPDVFTALKLLLVVVFWWISSPVSSHLLCRLEIVTDEQRSEYMTVHKHSLAQEHAAAADAPAPQEDGTDNWIEALKSAEEKKNDGKKEEQA